MTVEVKPVFSESYHKQVWVILLNWNQYRLTQQCLRSLQEVRYPGLQVLLVDNGSQDGSVSKLRAEFGAQVSVIANPQNLGFAEGNNVGIRYALEQGADYILLLNNDTIVDSEFIAPLVERFRLNPKAAAVTSKIYYLPDPEQSTRTHREIFWAAGGQIRWWLGAARCRGQGEWDHGQFDQADMVDYAQGCCFLASRAAFQIVGHLDTSFFIYFEDSDWSLRCRAAGLEIWYEPASVIWPYGRPIIRNR